MENRMFLFALLISIFHSFILNASIIDCKGVFKKAYEKERKGEGAPQNNNNIIKINFNPYLYRKETGLAKAWLQNYRAERKSLGDVFPNSELDSYNYVDFEVFSSDGGKTLLKSLKRQLNFKNAPVHFLFFTSTTTPSVKDASERWNTSLKIPGPGEYLYVFISKDDISATDNKKNKYNLLEIIDKFGNEYSWTQVPDTKYFFLIDSFVSTVRQMLFRKDNSPINHEMDNSIILLPCNLKKRILNYINTWEIYSTNEHSIKERLTDLVKAKQSFDLSRLSIEMIGVLVNNFNPDFSSNGIDLRIKKFVTGIDSMLKTE